MRDRGQVMANLMSNAAKFSPASSVVEVTAVRVPGAMRIGVTDHGPGIPEEFQEKIFGKFNQANSSDSRRRAGTGLGLNIAKSIVELHGGDIGFETKAGQGTTFFVTFPESVEKPNIAEIVHG